MSSDTLATVPAALGIPERAHHLRVVPRRRYGQGTAAVAVLVLLGLATASVVRNKAFPRDVVADCFTTASVLLGLWLTLWYTVVTSVLGIGRHSVEKHSARGTGTGR